MTVFGDNIYSGTIAPTSAASSTSTVRLIKTHRIAGGTGSTVTGTFPQGTMALAASLYIMLNASATVSDKITVSAGGVDFVTFTQFGSAAGLLSGTTTGLGIRTIVASACGIVAGAASSDLTYSVTYPTNTQATGADYLLELTFSRKDALFD